MRIVMLTDDASMIDRRILLHADALIDEGHEVFVIGRAAADVPPARRMGRVKVINIEAPPPRLSGPGPLGALRSIARSFATRSTPTTPSWLQSLRRRALSVAKLMQHYRSDFDGYFEIQGRRIADPWIPFDRRLRIAAKSIVVASLASVFAGLYWSYTRFSGRARSVGSDHLSRPFALLPWDRALISWAIYLDPDVIHVHDLPQLCAGHYVKRRLNIPLIYDAHEIYSEISTLDERQKAFLKARERRYIRSANHVYSVNPFCSQWFTEQYGCTTRTITNATSRPEGFDPAQKHRRFHDRLSLPANVRILCYQGWFSPHGRGLFELVQSLKLVRSDVHLVMVGYGDHERFREIARNSGVADRLHLIETVPWDELLWWTASADVGVIPYQPVDLNHLYCSPNKLSEFITAQLPMLANDLPYLRQVIEGEGFGLVRPMSTPENMAAAINEIFTPESGHLERAKRNLAERSKNWEWEEEQKKLISLYRSLPEPRRPSYASGPARVHNKGPITPPDTTSQFDAAPERRSA